MAHCTKCGKDVGCGCNLSNGLCGSCLSSVSVNTESSSLKTTERVVYPKSEPAPNTEFDRILNTQGLSKEEKLRRINDILIKAQQDANQL